MPQTMIDCTCEQCGKHFQVTLGTFNRGTTRFCSNPCRHQSMRDQAEARFWSQVDKSPHPKGCWIWTGAKARFGGYGRFFASGWHGAHRFAWELKHGPIPDKLLACHTCDNPPCCNPDHIFLGTHLDNFADMRAKGRSAKGDKNHTRQHPETVRGERNPNAKLTAIQVAEIRAAYQGDGRKTKVGGLHGRASTPTLKQLAAQYGVAFSVIHGIVSGQIWKDIS